jgi:hypothetical protein
MINAQEAFQRKFASSQNQQIEYLDLSGAAANNHYLNGKTLKPEEEWLIKGLQGELDLSSLPNLKYFQAYGCPELTKIKFGEKMVFIDLYRFEKITNLEGLEKCVNLVHLGIKECPNLQPPFTFLDS